MKKLIALIAVAGAIAAVGAATAEAGAWVTIKSASDRGPSSTATKLTKNQIRNGTMRVTVRAPRGAAIVSGGIWCYSQDSQHIRYPTWRYRSRGQTWTQRLPYWWSDVYCNITLDAASARGGLITLKLQRFVA